MVRDGCASPARARAAIHGIFAAAWMAGAGCMTFAGEELQPAAEDASATSVTSSGGGGGGDGGAAPTNDPEAYLPVLDAAELCAVAAECPLLGPSIVAAIGVPIVGIDALGPRIDLSYSACLDWLSSPLARGRIGFEAQRELLYGVVAAGCAGGLAFLPIEGFGAEDDRCDGQPAQRCEGDVLLDCVAGLSRDCTSPPYSAATTCIETGDESATCGIAHPCGDAEPSCDGSFAVGCAEDVLTAFDCATVGLGCSASTPGACGGQSGAASCAGDAFGQQACSPDGERATVCLGGFVGETDCDAVGLACVADGGASRCGDPARETSGERCSPYDPEVDVCQGDVLHACIGGAHVDIDCPTIGRVCKAPLELGALHFSARCGLGDG